MLDYEASGISESLSLTMDGGGSENSRWRGFTDSSLSSTELKPGVLEALSMASSYSSGGGEKDQTWMN